MRTLAGEASDSATAAQTISQGNTYTYIHIYAYMFIGILNATTCYYETYRTTRAQNCASLGETCVKKASRGNEEFRVYWNHGCQNLVKAASAIERGGGAGELQGTGDTAADVIEHVDELTVGGAHGEGQLVALQVVA